MAFTRILIEHPESASQFLSICNLRPGPIEGVQALQNYFGGLNGGLYYANMDGYVGAVQSTGTVTFASTGPTDGQTCIIGNVTFTASDTSNTDKNFDVSSDDPTEQAANLAAAINRSGNGLGDIISATSALGVVTLTAAVPGKIGNGLQLSSGADNTTIGAFASGTDANGYNLDRP